MMVKLPWRIKDIQTYRTSSKFRTTLKHSAGTKIEGTGGTASYITK
jgi:hypothetical protein